MNTVFLGEWAEDSGLERMVKDFEGIYGDDWLELATAHATRPKYKEINLLLASYETGCYDGTAFVLYEKDGILYEVNASHCSCHGLENEWEPEATTWDALEKHFDHEHSDQQIRKALRQIREKYDSNTK